MINYPCRPLHLLQIALEQTDNFLAASTEQSPLDVGLGHLYTCNKKIISIPQEECFNAVS